MYYYDPPELDLANAVHDFFLVLFFVWLDQDVFFCVFGCLMAIFQEMLASYEAGKAARVREYCLLCLFRSTELRCGLCA